jgi:uncharacterized protein (DUF2336 family)
MGIGEFLLWLERAKVEERCEAARSVARTVTATDLDAEERCAVDAALMILLDDQSAKVRRVLAETLSLFALAPEAALHMLALDQADVAAPVVARSSLRDETLILALDKGDADIAALIADRAKVSERLALAIAERGDLRACLALLTNPGARCTEPVFALIIDRLSAQSAELRGVLAGDERLSLGLRQKVTEAAAAALRTSRFVTALLGARRADTVCTEASDDAPLLLAEAAQLPQIPAFVRTLQASGRLTSGLLMRALVHGRIDFAAGMMADLSGQSPERVRAVLVRGGTAAITALLKDCGMKGAMPMLGARALELWRAVATGRSKLARQDIAWQLAVAASSADAPGFNDDVAAFMRRIHMDVARAVAQENARGMVEQARQEEQRAMAAEAALEDGFIEAFSEALIDEELFAALGVGAGQGTFSIDGVDFLPPETDLQIDGIDGERDRSGVRALSGEEFVIELEALFSHTAPAHHRAAA